MMSSSMYGSFGAGGRSSRSSLRGSYSNPPSRSQTPVRSRSSSIEPSSYGSSFSRPPSRASSLQNLSGSGSSGFSSSSFTSNYSYNNRKPVIEPASLNRYKSASLTGLSTPSGSSFTPAFSYKQLPSFSSSSSRYSRDPSSSYSSSSTSYRTSLLDIRRPATIIDRYPSDRFQSYGNRYSSASSPITTLSPTMARYSSAARTPSPTVAMSSLGAGSTSRFYAGANPYLSSYANAQGIGAYTKLLKYSFATGANRDRSSDFTPPAIITRGVNKDRTDRSSEYRSDYGSSSGGPYVPRSSYYEYGGGGGGSSRASAPSFSSSSYRSGISSRYGGDSDGGGMDSYRTRFQPTGAMSKYWTKPRKLVA